MVAPIPLPDTLDDLLRVNGQAELISGRIVKSMPTGIFRNRVAKKVFRSLDDHVAATRVGDTFMHSVGYAIRPPMPNGRESFSPDASYHAGPFPEDDWQLLEGPPTFAVEVRSPGEYGPAAEGALADKRADYFFAATQRIWDVDPDALEIAVYCADHPTRAIVFRRGDVAEAEPAVPGSRMHVGAIFG